MSYQTISHLSSSFSPRTAAITYSSLTNLHPQQKLATLDEKDEPLTDKQKQARTRLGEKAIRAITRLSAIPMPDLQSAFFGEKS